MLENKMIKVSIVVPVYNVEKYLVRCLDSLIEQTYGNLEILLIDDGATDNSGRICEEYVKLDNRISVYHKKNGGLSDARNYGIDKCCGEYIFFVDSDDWIEANTIELLLTQAVNRELDISCCGIEKNFNSGNRELFTDMGNELFTTQSALANYLHGNKICTVAWNKLYKIELFENIRYPFGKINEDEFTTYKLIMRAKRIGYIEKPLYHYFQRDDSIMGTKKLIDKLDILDALVERMDEFRKAGYMEFAGETWIQLIDTAYYYRFRASIINEGKRRIDTLLKMISEKQIVPTWNCVRFRYWLKTHIKLLVLTISDKCSD